jgi:hypothetical protein
MGSRARNSEGGIVKKKSQPEEKRESFQIQELDDAALAQVDGGAPNTPVPTINNGCNLVAHCGG